MKNKILGHLSPSQFLRDYWQKKPLLIRQAFPHFKGLLNKQELISLSLDEEAQSRLIHSHRKTWSLEHGPFKKNDFTKLPPHWTLLVQDINHFLPEANTLLKHFNFIPYSRLDDVMVSFATDGSGVGPHFDSYDVFLLQGSGKRRWQISNQEDRSLLPNAPLRILKHFKSEEEYVLEPGDMLYLPPNYAHDGVAVGESMTYSIGFRAPSHQEIVREFLFYLQDHLTLDGIYSDPDLRVAKHPAQISNDMVNKIRVVLKQIRFGKKEIKGFLGNYLSEPKATVFFHSPESPLGKKKFLKTVKQKGICLNLKSQMLFVDDTFFMNGEMCTVTSEIHPYLKKLADEREMVLPEESVKELDEILYEWYLNGYVEMGC